MRDLGIFDLWDRVLFPSFVWILGAAIEPTAISCADYLSNLEKQNENAEFNLRNVEAGKKIFLDQTLKIFYYPHDSYRALSQQYFRYGQGRAYTTWKHRALTSWRQAAPVVLVIFLLVFACFGVLNPIFFLLVLPYPILMKAAALFRPLWGRVSLGEDKEPAPAWNLRPLLAIAFMTMDVSWGLGFLWASFRRLISPRGSTA
jgi:succinoglycan biosynthesis protein ExoA